jgi:hypothetical protein
VERETDLVCSQVASVERLLHQTLASIHLNILCPVQVSLGKKNEKNHPRIPNGFLYAYLLFCVMFLQLLSQGSADVIILWAEVSWARGAIAAAEAAYAGHGIVNLHINGAEDWVALAEWEALEWVSRVEVENSAGLSYSHAGAEDLARKFILLEDKLS